MPFAPVTVVFWLLLLAGPQGTAPAQPAAPTDTPRLGSKTVGEREVAFDPADTRFPLDTRGSLEVSIYSFPSRLFSSQETERLLEAVRLADPDRTLVVLGDRPPASRPGCVWIRNDGRFSPWPRDPFRLAYGNEGDVRVLVRPNLQPGRETDSELGLELVRSLPESLGGVWGSVQWSRSPVPFHNGQVLLTGDRAWISLHTLEDWILEMLGLEHVPVASFSTGAGIDRYLGAARKAVGELESFYGREVAFVHPLPDAVNGEPAEAERRRRMERIGGGAGVDLDSILTLVPGKEGTAALVADPSLGARLVPRITGPEWQAFRDAYRLWPEPKDLAARLSAAQTTPRAVRLDGFVDLVAENLARRGLEVRRLPLVLVPTALLEEREFSHEDFLVTWNNVVVETGPNGPRAEGFASLLETADREAERIFEAMGLELDLLPPLTTSIVLNGGYRCASNHLRSRPGSRP